MARVAFCFLIFSACSAAVFGKTCVLTTGAMAPLGTGGRASYEKIESRLTCDGQKRTKLKVIDDEDAIIELSGQQEHVRKTEGVKLVTCNYRDDKIEAVGKAVLQFICTFAD